MTSANSPLHIVMLSHLAWERKLFQRPQQLMTRFAQMGNPASYFAIVAYKKYMMMRLEERVLTPHANLHAQNLPFVPLSRYLPILGALTLKLMYAKARPMLQRGPKGRRVLWIQNPSYVQAPETLKGEYDLLVYDVMDPHREFASAGSQAAQHEEQILKRADVVFTGGRSLQGLVSGVRPDAHCFPSGIDYRHFARGAEPGAIPADLAKLKKPVLGYFGAVDERIDWKLVETLCRERRHWNIVFLGPLIMMDKVPINEPNFHYLGPKPYDALPDYLRGFDVCLIPWVVNNLTKFMSPTKTPEYLAAGRPVVSTPVPDLMAEYGDEALTAHTPEEFVRHCTTALMKGSGPAHKPAQARTWDEIAEQMLTILHEAAERKPSAK